MSKFKTYHTLPEDAVSIRKRVFMEEQGFQDEFDDIDEIADHIVLYEADMPAATCRIYWNAQKQDYVVGRIAVIKEFRGKSFGAAMLREAENQVKKQNGKALYLAAQVRAKGFYEKSGYTAVGEEFLEEYCPHVWMYKKL